MLHNVTVDYHFFRGAKVKNKRIRNIFERRAPRAHASTFLFGRSGAAKEATLPSVVESGKTVSVPTIVIVFRRAVGLSATMVFGTEQTFMQMLCFPLVGTQSLFVPRIAVPKTISASIPNARSFDPVTCFAAKHPLPRPTLFTRRDFPSHKPFSEVSWASSYAWGFRFSKNFLNRAFRLLPNLILAIL